MRKPMLVATMVIAAGFGSVACGRAPDRSATIGVSDGAPAATTPLDPKKRAEQGQKLYIAWCSGCHGERGRADGPAAAFLVPKPRNFLTDRFKVRSTPSGKPPRRDDLLGTLVRGLPGTPMPSFGFLTEDERGLIVDHVRKLAGLDQKPEVAALTAGAEPASTPESVDRGKALYAKLGCAACHGATGKGDGDSSKTLKDDKGQPLPARDYTKGLFMGGDTATAIRMRFVTGMDGSPMPSFADAMPNETDGWDLANYILSLRTPKEPYPTDKVALGRRVVDERHCNGCHVIEGKGAQVGPSLDVVSAKLRFDYAKVWLTDPPAQGKVYPYMPYRMPNLGLTAEEIDGVLAYFASIAHRDYPESPPAAPKFDKETIAKGQLLYFLKCTECHNMGTIVPTPAAKQQGPDLLNISTRLRFDFMHVWVDNPKAMYPDSKMVDTNLTPAEIDQVTAFVWSTSVEGSKSAKPSP